jgi:CubicO group peptidase (beta-lactamase class C family)
VRIETAPGTEWKYSGGGYTVVQQAMIDAGEKPFGELVAWSVLAPLGMASSTFAQPLPAALLPRAAAPHNAKGEPYKGGAYTYPELAAAGLWTTPSDLARFAIGVQRTARGQQPPESGLVLLPPELAHAMLTPVKNDYALGFEIEGKGADRSFAHGGSNMGFQNSLYAYVERGDGIVVMTNGDAGAELAQSIVRAAAFEYRWPDNQTTMRKAVDLSPARRKAVVGTYEIQGLGTFEIAEQNGKLVLGIREGVIEPLYAAPGSPTVLFVLSRELELHMAKDGSPAGRLHAGSF